MMISTAEAGELAQNRVSELGGEAGQEFELLVDKTVKVDSGWVFFYNSAEFVRTGNASHALAGNGPIHVSYEGKLTHLPTAAPWQEAVRRLAG